MGEVMDILAYAKKNLLPRLDEALKDLESRREKLEGATKAFADTLPGVEKNLCALKERMETLLKEINTALVFLKGCGPDFPYDKVKSALEKQLSELRFALTNENVKRILEIMESQKELMPATAAGAGDAELRLCEETDSTLTRLLTIKEFATLGESLQELVATCQNLFKQKTTPEAGVVYGFCYPRDICKTLYRFDVGARKIVPCAAVVPKCCSVLQIERRIFISGGTEPTVNTVSEFVEKTQSLMSKAPMHYAKMCHAMIAVSQTNFITIGGHSGNGALEYCEEYSVQNDTWQMLPSLGWPRYHAGAALPGDGAYLYAVGGCDSFNSIERLDMKERKVWSDVTISGGAEVSLNGCSVAFPISADEIMIFVGGDAPNCGVYNAKTETVKKHLQNLKPDSYCFNNPVCTIDGDVYIIGAQYAHLHIFRAASGKLEEIDYHEFSS